LAAFDARLHCQLLRAAHAARMIGIAIARRAFGKASAPANSSTA
jgi:hypothetical protein